MTIKVGDLVRFSTQDHGHLAAARIKTFVGRVTYVGQPFQTPYAGEMTTLRVLVGPTFKTNRYVTIGRDAVEVIG